MTNWCTAIAVFLLGSGVSLADQTQSQQVRVSLQFIEVPHAFLTELLTSKETSGPAIHAKAISLAKAGEGKILETCIVTGQSGQKFLLESIREEIYPTEYDPPELPGSPPAPRNEPPIHPSERAPTAFDTRNTGITFEVAASIEDHEKAIRLHLAPEIVTRLRLDSLMELRDPWGVRSVSMPVFEAWRTNTTVTVVPGKFELVTVITPKSSAPGPTVLRKILMFVRADISYFNR